MTYVVELLNKNQAPKDIVTKARVRDTMINSVTIALRIWCCHQK